MYCSKCGGALAEGAMYCSTCGTRTEKGLVANDSTAGSADVSVHSPKSGKGIGCGCLCFFIGFIIIGACIDASNPDPEEAISSDKLDCAVLDKKAHVFNFPGEDEGKTFFGYEWGGKTCKEKLKIDFGILKWIELLPSALEDAPMSGVMMSGDIPNGMSVADSVEYGRALVVAIEKRYKVNFPQHTDYCYTSSTSPKGLQFIVSVGVYASGGPKLELLVWGPEKYRLK